MARVITQQVGDILVFNLFEEETRARIRYYLNLKEYELVVTGEITASYKWVSGTKESFIALMLRSSKEYLLDKLSICRNPEFNLNESIKETVNTLKDDYDLFDIEDFIAEIEAIDCATSETFCNLINKYLNDYCLYGLEISDFIKVVEEPCHWLRRSVALFCSEIKPLLKGGE